MNNIEEIRNVSKEVESIEVDATNFIEERDKFEDEHPRTNFLDYISDAQLVRIARTSFDYGFDEEFGIISEVLDRTETEVPEELESEQYQDIYEEALDKLERKDIISKSIEEFYKKHGFVCALEVDETEQILSLWEKSLEDEGFEEFFEANYNSLIREFAKAKSLKHFRLRQADDFYGNETQPMVDFIRENQLLETYEDDLKQLK